jgi:predicted AlkP superfamily phosphohydrolase/phosphomutase
LLLSIPASAMAYVGPGAGIAIGTTALALLASLVALVVGMLLWPLRFLYKIIRRRRPPKAAQVKRIVVVGLDGLDPVLAERFIAEGKLPNLARLADKGEFKRLHTTYPAMSPVAWSSFATGVNPAKHGIFDFLTRDTRTYAPDLSSAEIRPSKRSLKLGKWEIPLGAPQVKLLRKSKPFWEVLSRYDVPCSILRVPITFPPQKLSGTMLSAMCVPDLQGTQGSFTYYSSEEESDAKSIGGWHVPVKVVESTVQTKLLGPPNPMRPDGPRLECPFTVTLAQGDQPAKLRVGRRTFDLPLDGYTDWIDIAFPLGLPGMKLRGICRFRLMSCPAGAFRLYVSPINIDPARPVLPISYPGLFSVFLSKLIGRYSTLGLAEDTWALNEGVLDEKAFLEQAWSNHREREGMFFEMLNRHRRGVLTCVFDGTDRIQHMFMRYLDDGHPALKEEDRDSPYKDVIEQTYQRVDEMVGRVMKKVDINDPNNLLLVMSDHGFQTFRRGVNLNAWLLENGYLALEEGHEKSGEWLRHIDWSRTRAYALGLGGIFLNVAGREAKGIVAAEDAHALADELAERLTGLRDDGYDAVAIKQAYASHRLYRGPYKDQAPDVIVGYERGWRASWSCARGIADRTVFSDNTKAWSGDHCIDPTLVPGVLFTNQKLGKADEEPVISDLAPTMLELLGVPAPGYMDGRSLIAAGS